MCANDERVLPNGIPDDLEPEIDAVPSGRPDRALDWDDEINDVDD